MRDWLLIEALRKTYPGPIVAIDDVSIAVGEGEFFAIVGPSNAGKSTLLKTIAGVELPDRGLMKLAGRDLAALEPRGRRLSLLFQNIALFPNRTGFENIAFPMRAAKRSETEIRTRVAEVAALLKIDHLLGRLPRTFSGGEQQRVAIARAVVLPADLLMLDEPLTNLDARIRIALRLAFKKLHRDSGQTMLYVTHDQVEALSMAERIGVLHQGRFVQIGTPHEVYFRPTSEFVARFIGSPPMNIFDVKLEGKGDTLLARGQDFEVKVNGVTGLGARLPTKAAVGVRPEEIHAAPERSPEAPHPGKVIWIERLGSHQILDVRLGGQLIKVRTRAGHSVDREGPAWFGFSTNASRILDLDTGLFAVADPHSLTTIETKKEMTTCV
jgi:multiple sugar transport system ATP-binding protein